MNYETGWLHLVKTNIGTIGIYAFGRNNVEVVGFIARRNIGKC